MENVGTSMYPQKEKDMLDVTNTMSSTALLESETLIRASTFLKILQELSVKARYMISTNVS
jgi:hypothetical protein